MDLTGRHIVGTSVRAGGHSLNLNRPYTNNDKDWTKSFLAEIQEKANNIKLRNTSAIENGQLQV
jgi:hypothetical protein